LTTVDLVNVSNYILKNVTLHVPSGSIHVVIGPNGAGKTTLLKVIAGLTWYRGSVRFNGESVDKLPPWRRKIGYLPQTTALFPHMTVLENVVFGLRNAGLSFNDSVIIAKHYLELLGIYELRNRYPLTLSGGEQRKVALARALAIRPRILLLDEPFTGIHYDYRVQIANTIRKINKDEGLTVIIVTHDLDEALEIGSNFTILMNGEIMYSGNLKGLLKAINKYLHYINVFECTIKEYLIDAGLARVNCHGLELIVPIEYEELRSYNRVLVTIPADRVILYQTEKCYPRINCVRGKVTRVESWSNNLKLVKVVTDKINVNVITNYEVLTSDVVVKLPIKNLKVYIID